MIERGTTPVERFLGRALSLSSVSHSQIGAHADDLAREMRAAMTVAATTGMATEVVAANVE